MQSKASETTEAEVIDRVVSRCSTWLPQQVQDAVYEDLAWLEGYLAAIAICPGRSTIDDWVKHFFASSALPDGPGAREMVTRAVLMRHERAKSLLLRGTYTIDPDILDNGDEVARLELWTNGFCKALTHCAGDWRLHVRLPGVLQDLELILTFVTKEDGTSLHGGLAGSDLARRRQELLPEVGDAAQALFDAVRRRRLVPHPQSRNLAKLGRNDPCLCGSGKKFKKCCMN